ncbi:MAG: peptide-methionine (S)-S-oxide reductase MsrA [Acholeplasmatales bacterium]|nr:peptide-methionine (S)-S-oxide reductase MsrA [Acholeplasmatales bacterium]
MKNPNLKKFVFIAIMIALSVVLGIIEIPFNDYLKLDLSDLIIIVCLLSLGLNSSLIILVFRFIFRYLIIALPQHEAVVGLYTEGVAIISSLILILLIFSFSKLIKLRKLTLNLALVVPLSVISFSAIMVLLNFLFITPSYFSFYTGEYRLIGYRTFLNNPQTNFFHHGDLRLYFLECLSLYGVFNLIKGSICLTLSFILDKLLYKKLKDLIIVKHKRIILAGGCFWGVEAFFQKLQGVIKTTCVYVDGDRKNPKYEDLKQHLVSHAEGVLLVYDPQVINLNQLLKYFFTIVDPYSINKQGHDEGLQYRSGIYCFGEEDYLEVQEYLKINFASTLPLIKTQIKLNSLFYPAERYHQDYLIKHPTGYCHVNLNILDNDPQAKKHLK